MIHKTNRIIAVASVAIVWSLIGPTHAEESKAYMVGLVNVSNKDWVAEYRKKNNEILNDHGGRILVRGKPAEVLEGAGPDADAIIVVEFSSMEKAQGWYNDPRYKPLIKLRQTGAEVDFLLMEALQQ